MSEAIGKALRAKYAETRKKLLACEQQEIGIVFPMLLAQDSRYTRARLLMIEERDM